MTNAKHERVLRQFFLEEAAAAVPPDLLDHSLARTATARRRPGWYARIRDVGIARPWVVGRPTMRVVYLLALLGLVLAALFVAIASGAFRRDPFSPLGRNGAIVYSVQDSGGYPHSAPDTVFLLNGAGTEAPRIAGGSCPTFSTDGRVFAYKSEELTVAAADGSWTHAVPGVLAAEPGLDRYGAWSLSPDGTLIAWVKPITTVIPSARDGSIATKLTNNELWVTPVSGGPGNRIVPASSVPTEAFWAPVWSPDSRQIGFEINGVSGRSAINVVGSDGSDLRTLSTRPARDQNGMAWSPDGRYLAYLGLPDGAPSHPSLIDPPLDVFVIGADGSGERNLTNKAAYERLPAWSPDGTHLAYVTSADVSADPYRLATIRMAGGTAIGRPVPGPEASDFVWSPDGTRLLWYQDASTAASSHAGAQLRTTLLSVDPEFTQAPTTVREIVGLMFCAPSWQRLEP